MINLIINNMTSCIIIIEPVPIVTIQSNNDDCKYTDRPGCTKHQQLFCTKWNGIEFICDKCNQTGASDPNTAFLKFRAKNESIITQYHNIQGHLVEIRNQAEARLKLYESENDDEKFFPTRALLIIEKSLANIDNDVNQIRNFLHSETKPLSMHKHYHTINWCHYNVHSCILHTEPLGMAISKWVSDPSSKPNIAELQGLGMVNPYERKEPTAMKSTVKKSSINWFWWLIAIVVILISMRMYHDEIKRHLKLPSKY